jgi:hypothetical protein
MNKHDGFAGEYQMGRINWYSHPTDTSVDVSGNGIFPSGFIRKIMIASQCPLKKFLEGTGPGWACLNPICLHKWPREPA